MMYLEAIIIISKVVISVAVHTFPYWTLVLTAIVLGAGSSVNQEQQ